MGKPEKAQSWYEKALAGYLESVQHGDVHYYHHLADFYADVRENGREAVKWAQRISNCGRISRPRPRWLGLITATDSSPMRSS